MSILISLAKTLMKEGNTNLREFYEYVLPPIDMYMSGKALYVVVDLPGIDEPQDIIVTVTGKFLHIKVDRKTTDDIQDDVIIAHRPRKIDLTMALPIEETKDNPILIKGAKYIGKNGVFTVILSHPSVAGTSIKIT